MKGKTNAPRPPRPPPWPPPGETWAPPRPVARRAEAEPPACPWWWFPAHPPAWLEELRELVVLQVLVDAPGGLSAAGLHEQFSVPLAAAASVLDDLEKAGLVQPARGTRSSADAEATVPRVASPAGRGRLEQLKKRWVARCLAPPPPAPPTV